jgi:outer membrane receptor protein involved in Fe transport
MAGTSVSVQFGHFDRTRSGADYDGGGLFSVNATHAEAPNQNVAYKLSAGLLTQEPLLRPIGNVPGTQTPYPSFQNRGTTQPKLDARADFTSTDRRQNLTLAGGIAGTDGIIHTGLGPISVARGSTYKYGHLTYERGSLKLRTFVNALDGEGVFLLQRGTDGLPIEPTFENQVYDFEFSNANVLGRRHLLSYGGNFRHNRFDLSLTPLGEYRNEGGGYVQDEIFLSDRARFIAGVRLDAFGIVDQTFLSPRTALILKLQPNHTLRFSYNRAFRAPSFFNSYMDMTFLSDIDLKEAGTFSFPSVAKGNLGLDGEALTAYEVAYSSALGRITLGAAAYLNQTDRMILFTQVGSYTSTNVPPGWPLPPAALDELVAAGHGLPSDFTYLNFNRVDDRGLELSLEARISSSVSSFGNYTWQGSPRPDGFSVEELNIPSPHRFNAGVSFNRARYFGGLSTSFQDKAFWQDVLDARYHGWTDPFWMVNASAGVRSSDGVMAVAVRAANLLNHTKQEHIFGDLIKRTLTGEVRFTF